MKPTLSVRSPRNLDDFVTGAPSLENESQRPAADSQVIELHPLEVTAPTTPVALEKN